MASHAARHSDTLATSGCTAVSCSVSVLDDPRHDPPAYVYVYWTADPNISKR